MLKSNRQWRLRTFPAPDELPTAAHFELGETAVPVPGPGEVLIQGIYLSLDPYMRGRIAPVKNYTDGVKPGDVMTGRTVGRIVQSNHPGFSVGEIVLNDIGWQEYGCSNGSGLRKVDPGLAPVSTALGLLGMPGLSAYFAFLDIGQPKAGDTVLVTAASGAVGSAVGQIAKIAGCRTVAIVGSARKVTYCLDELGYDAAIDYNAATDLGAAVRAAAPGGVNVFFDNAGGTIHQAILPHLAVHARVVVCGVMSQYNPTAKSRMEPYNLRQILVPRARIEGFLIYDFAHCTQEGLERLGSWYRDGRIKYRESIAEGIESAPSAFNALLRGENLGKQLVRLAPEEAI